MEPTDPDADLPSRKIDTWSRTIIALALGILLGALVTVTGLEALERHLSSLLIAFGVLILLAAGLAFFLVQNKEATLRRLFGVDNTDIGEAKNLAQSLFLRVWDRDFKTAEAHFNQLFTKVFAWYSWMSFRRWVVTIFNTLFVSFAGLLGTVLLYNQNKLLTRQNELIQRQTHRLDQQTYLQEAGRRSSLIFLMGRLLDAIDQELKADIGRPGIRDLSPQIIGQIVALSTGLRPYRYLDGDSLVAREISPERGQLLLSLVSSEIDNGTLRRIFLTADFSYAELSEAALAGEYLGAINLREANLSKTDLNGANLAGADLNRADLSSAIMVGTVLTKANLSDTDLREAIIEQTDFRGASLYGTDLRGVDFTTSDWRGAYFGEAKLDSALVPGSQWLHPGRALPRDSIVGGDYINKNYVVDSVATDVGQFEYFLVPTPKSRSDSVK